MAPHSLGRALLCITNASHAAQTSPALLPTAGSLPERRRWQAARPTCGSTPRGERGRRGGPRWRRAINALLERSCYADSLPGAARRLSPFLPPTACRHAAKTVVYRLHVSADGAATPLRLHMQGREMFSGSHFDECVQVLPARHWAVGRAGGIAPTPPARLLVMLEERRCFPAPRCLPL